MACLIALPMLLYSVIVFATEPVYSEWTAAQITTTGAPWFYLLNYLIPLMLAVPGWIYTVRQCEPGLLFLALWLVSVPLLIYAPTIAQRRLIDSWKIVLSIMASYGLIIVVLPALRRARFVGRFAHDRPRLIRRWQRLLIGALILFLIPTYVFVILWSIMAAVGHDAVLLSRSVVDVGH